MIYNFNPECFVFLKIKILNDFYIFILIQMFYDMYYISLI